MIWENVVFWPMSEIFWVLTLFEWMLLYTKFVLQAVPYKIQRTWLADEGIFHECSMWRLLCVYLLGLGWCYCCKMQGKVNPWLCSRVCTPFWHHCLIVSCCFCFIFLFATHTHKQINEQKLNIRTQNKDKIKSEYFSLLRHFIAGFGETVLEKWDVARRCQKVSDHLKRCQ